MIFIVKDEHDEGRDRVSPPLPSSLLLMLTHTGPDYRQAYHQLAYEQGDGNGECGRNRYRQDEAFRRLLQIVRASLLSRKPQLTIILQSMRTEIVG